MFFDQMTCSMDLRTTWSIAKYHGGGPLNMVYWHRICSTDLRTCDIAIAYVQWPQHMLYFPRAYLMDLRTCSIATEHFLLPWNIICGPQNMAHCHRRWSNMFNGPLNTFYCHRKSSTGMFDSHRPCSMDFGACSIAKERVQWNSEHVLLA